MDRPTRIVMFGMMIGICVFGGFELLTIFHIVPLGVAFNNFFTFVGVIIFFITGFLYISLITMPKEKQ